MLLPLKMIARFAEVNGVDTPVPTTAPSQRSGLPERVMKEFDDEETGEERREVVRHDLTSCRQIKYALVEPCRAPLPAVSLTCLEGK